MNEIQQEKCNEQLLDRVARLELKCSTLDMVTRSLDSLDLDKRVRKLENKLDIKVVK